MKTSSFDEHEQAQGRIGRVFFEGMHPDYGASTVLLLLLPVFEQKGLRGTCFMRVAHKPDAFTVGHWVRFEGLKGTVVYPNGNEFPINRVGPTFSTYESPGKIFSGG